MNTNPATETINIAVATSLYAQLVNASIKLPSGINFDDEKNYVYGLAIDEWMSDSMSISGLPEPTLAETKVTDKTTVSFLYSLMEVEDFIRRVNMPELYSDDMEDDLDDGMPNWEQVIGKRYALIPQVRAYEVIADEFPEYADICESNINSLKDAYRSVI